MMDRRYLNRLLREATKDPSLLTKRKKFWKLDFWSHYLPRCNDLLFRDPAEGLELTKPAPQLAARIAEINSKASGPDLMLMAYSYLGSAFRACGDLKSSEGAFEEAQEYRHNASPKVLAEHLRRLAYLRIIQHRPEVFPLVEEAIAIHKRGNLVNRHELGECLLCRGHGYFAFGQPGESLEDWSAALNHISIKVDSKSYYSTLHNLAIWAAEHGTIRQLQTTFENLQPAFTILNAYWDRSLAKLKFRWLIALLHARLGAHGRAEEVFGDVRTRLIEQNLVYEVGMVSIDLALLYLQQDRLGKLEALVRETVNIFQHLRVEAKAQEALDIWRRASKPTEDLLKNVRQIFAQQTHPMPSQAA